MDAKVDSHTLGAFNTGEFAIQEDLRSYEEKVGIFKWDTYELFSLNAIKILKSLSDEVEIRREQGFEIVFVGAAAKAMTVINSCPIRPDRFVDESPLKIGLHAPGVGTVIESLESCSTLDRPAFFVITAWNFRQELTSKLLAIGVPKGSIFYAYFPKPEVFLQL